MDIPTKFLLTPYNVYLELINLYNKKSKPEEAKLNLARWYNKVEKLGNNQFNKVIDTFKNHYQTIINYFQDRLTNASAGSFNAKIKAFRTQFRGVGDIKFLCIDWQNFMLSTLLYQLEKSADPLFLLIQSIL
ncbi:transposase [Prevotella bivia]|uniref:transposase n=1 Tax=Prevotella bivia TaxID=28125 RepID=UPI00254B26C8|nr:transposase [Prevotella bivia]WIL18832.1 transposase [Prevotella bivia]